MIRKMLVAFVLLTGMAWAQPQFPQDGPGGGMERGGPRPGVPGGVVPPGRWWKNAEVVKTLGLGDEQVQKIEKIFSESRLKLVDAHANLQKEEFKLEPLLDADTPDEAAVLAAIDRITAARAVVEKANAQMGFAIRRVLTPEQWKKLRALPMPDRRLFPGPKPGPGDFSKRQGHPSNGGPNGGSDASPDHSGGSGEGQL
ncbi:MAG: Spy/CpxP family protein refolding chaperone [Acidobacteriota bacterium]|nr:Spy/CpxP family protein refolding chaperone [Acidobacteriota bacterium]